MPRQLTQQEASEIEDEIVRKAPSGLSDSEFDRYFGPAFEQAKAVAENTPAPLQGSALRRALSGVWEQVNPVAIGKSLYTAVTNPIDTISNVVTAQGQQFSKAGQAAGQGRYVEAAGHAAAGLLPVVGPASAAIGEDIAVTGDVATGVGRTVGLVGPTMAPSLANGARGLLPKGVRERAATALESGASGRVADVMAPKVGANKARFGRAADKVAPQVARELAADGAPFSRAGLQATYGQKLTTAENALDAASDARLAARSFETQPLIDALLQKRRTLTAEAVDASQASRKIVTRQSPILDSSGKPTIVAEAKTSALGRDVVPGPNAARVAVIDQAIAELQQLGPTTRYDPVRMIRQAYDGPAKATYHPSVTQDFLKAQGGKLGAADVTGVLRDALAKFDPDTAVANAQYSLYRTVDDVLQATAEVERTRPRVGRQIAARLGGAVVGAEAKGTAGAVTGYLLGPVIDGALGGGATTQLQTARMMQRLAEAIRKGDVQQVYSLTDMLKRTARTSAGLASRSMPSQGSPEPSAAGAMP
jgi:hypothetical protein